YAIVNYDTVKGFSKPTEIEHTTDSAAGKRTVIIWVIDPNEVANSVYIYRMYQGVWHYVGMINEPAYDARHAFFDEYYELTDGGDPGDTTDFSPENLDGVYTYAYTFYNSAEGRESKPSPLTNELTLVNGQVEISNLQVSTDPQIDKKRIYRIGGNYTTFALVAEINNELTTYVDNIPDVQIPGTPLESEEFGQAPEG